MDTSKADKLAAAKKKLKQFQLKSGGKNLTATQLKDYTLQENKETSIVASVTNGEDESMPMYSENAEASNMAAGIRDHPLYEAFENLKKEKEDILLSLKSSQDNVKSLVIQLEEERRVGDDARERLTLLEKAYCEKKELKEEELKHTLSIIVEEKNELAAAYKESQEQLKSLQLNLVATEKLLEESKSALKEFMSSKKTEASELQSSTSELELAKEELRHTKEKLSELNDELTDLRNRHGNVEKELAEKDSQNKELILRLELSNLNLQQLRNAGPPTVDQSLELSQRENRQLQEQIQALREQIGKVSVEKDVLAQQYEQYISRLNGQVRSLTSQIETMAAEKRSAEASLDSKNDSIKTLECVIADLRKELEARMPTSEEKSVSVVEEKYQESLQQDSNLEELRKQIHRISMDNDQLAKLVLEKESQVQESQIKIDRLQNELSLATANQNSSEREKLLQAMQSDKTAAARAINQNRQLKVQLEELEKAFIQLSNDKLALTEQSQTSLRVNKELNDKIATMEPELLRLRDQVSELASQRDATVYWKQELEEAHERIQALSHQNFELKKRVVWNLSQTPVKNGRKHKHADEHHHEEGTCNHSDKEEDEDWIPNEEHEKLKFHYGELEKQHKKSLVTIAALNEEKKRLDHLVIQLQSETETIGEYVSLYQVQRGVLRQRAEQLAKERQVLKERIENLKSLMPIVAPKLKDSPYWKRLEPFNAEDAKDTNRPADEHDIDNVASNIVAILQDISLTSLTELPNESIPQPDFVRLEQCDRLPHENFHPCQICSGRLMTV